MKYFIKNKYQQCPFFHLMKYFLQDLILHIIQIWRIGMNIIENVRHITGMEVKEVQVSIYIYTVSNS